MEQKLFHNFIRHISFNSVVLASTLSTFTFLAVVPNPVSANIGFNDIAMGIRVQTLANKAKKYLEKMDSNKLFDVMLDLKNEVEQYTGISVNLDYYVDQVISDLKKQGTKMGDYSLA